VDFNKWISLISCGSMNVDFVGGWWISWISLLSSGFRYLVSGFHGNKWISWIS